MCLVSIFFCMSDWVKVAQSCLTLHNPMLYSPWNSPGQNPGVGSLSLLQGIFPTQESSRGLLHCRQILYQLSHKAGEALSSTQMILKSKHRNFLVCPGAKTLHWQCWGVGSIPSWELRSHMLHSTVPLQTNKNNKYKT